MSWFGPYVWDVFANWFTIALLILGLNDLSKWMGGRSWKWLSDHRWKLVIVYLLIAQAMAYQKLVTRPVPATPAASPVVAENPDHARLAERLEAAERDVRSLQDERNREREERNREREAREAAEKKVGELRRELSATRGKAADCDRLANLSAQGLTLISNLRARDADQESRSALNKWFADVCSALSPAQCAAFRAAPPASGSWVNYPVEDGGYSQTSRGRSAYLSAQLANLCR